MKKHSLVIFDLSDHSPTGRARVVEYLAKRFEISPDIVGAKLRNLPFVLRNWLDDDEIAEVKNSLEENHCIFDIVENLGNLSDLAPPKPKTDSTPAAAPQTAHIAPPASPVSTSAPAPIPSVTPEPTTTPTSSLDFELTEPSASELNAVKEQLDTLETASGVIRDKAPEKAGSLAMPTGEFSLTFDEPESPKPPEQQSVPAPQPEKNATQTPVTEQIFDSLSFDESASSASATPPLPTEAEPASQPTPNAITTQIAAAPASSIPDLDLSLSEAPVDIKPLVEEFEDLPATPPAEETFDLKPDVSQKPVSLKENKPNLAQPQEAPTAKPASLTSSKPPAPASKPSAREEQTSLPSEPEPDDDFNGDFSDDLERNLSETDAVFVEAPLGKQKRTFTLLHALGLFVVAVGVSFYFFMPRHVEQQPMVAISEDSIDKLLKEQEQILNPIVSDTRSISRWTGKTDRDRFSTTVNISLDLNQVMLNDLKGYASIELAGTGKEPPKLTPEELVARKPFPIWVNRFEASLAKFSHPDEQRSDSRKFEASGEARVYMKQAEKTSRIIANIKIIGSLNLDSKKITGTWYLASGTDFPTEGAEPFAEKVDESFRFFESGIIEAEPVASASSSSSSRAARSSRKKAENTTEQHESSSSEG